GLGGFRWPQADRSGNGGTSLKTNRVTTACDLSAGQIKLSPGWSWTLNTDNSNGNRDSNNFAQAGNTEPVDSKPRGVGSSRSNRTGCNTGCSSRGLRARSPERKLRARSRRRHRG